MGIRQGYYRHIIEIQQKVAVQDEFGGDTFEWQAITNGTVWANRVPFSGRALVASKAEYNEANVRFFTGYRDDVSGDMRIIWKGKVHDIVGEPIDVGGTGEELEILTKTGTNEG